MPFSLVIKERLLFPLTLLKLLTIDGVKIVIDCGLARIPSYDDVRGINTLLLNKISVASADQRAGRAGRVSAGSCIRLWSESDHAMRDKELPPEIKRLDLAEIVLLLAVFNSKIIDDLNGLILRQKSQ